MISPVVVSIKTQQTPNPAAQFPEAVPPLSLHSVEVKHVPFRPALDEVHPSFLKVTTLKSEKTAIELFISTLP